MSTGIFFGILHAFSLGFAFLTLWRLFSYIRRYRFDESKYTLLFGFVHLRFIAGMYIVFAIAWVIVSFVFIF